MIVSDIMTTQVITLEPTDSLLRAMSVIESTGLRHLPITQDGRLVGIVSDRDVKRDRPSALNEEARAAWRAVVTNTSLSMVMSRSVVTVGPNETVLAATRRLIGARVGSLAVVEDERLVGIVTYHDLLRLLSQLLADEPRRSTSRKSLLWADSPPAPRRNGGLQGSNPIQRSNPL